MVCSGFHNFDTPTVSCFHWQAELCVQTSEESETSAGRLHDAEASSAALQTELKQLQDSQEAQAIQSSQAQAEPISQEDADGMLLTSAFFDRAQSLGCLVFGFVAGCELNQPSMLLDFMLLVPTASIYLWR